MTSPGVDAAVVPGLVAEDQQVRGPRLPLVVDLTDEVCDGVAVEAAMIEFVVHVLRADDGDGESVDFTSMCGETLGSLQ